MPDLVLSGRLYEKLREEAIKRGVTVEELAIDVLSKELKICLDPSERVELHLKLSEKFLREAEELLAKGDYVQASEKAWGAASQMVKALAVKEGGELRSHASLWEYVNKVAKRLGDVELRHLWGRANNLHQNFYENWMPPEEVEAALGDVRDFVKKLRELL
jgi:uncharacterized protein (UPF0332 family)